MRQREDCHAPPREDRPGLPDRQMSVYGALPAETLPAAGGQVFCLHEGITAYVLNPEGTDFTVSLDVRDVNSYANGPREILWKVYDPDGRPVVREVIPDDGCKAAGLPDRIGGWDHELQYFINHYAKGTTPAMRWAPGPTRPDCGRSSRGRWTGRSTGASRVYIASCWPARPTITSRCGSVPR